MAIQTVWMIIMHRLIGILVLFVILMPGMAFSKVYLVSVGIADYPGNSRDLRLAANDAKAVANLYSRNNGAYSVCLINSDATKTNIINAMKRTFASAGTEDMVVFFFSGHGYRGGFVAYDGTLSYSDVRNAMAGSRSRYKMIFADACLSGSMRTKERGTSGSVAAAKRASVMLFLSSRDTEVSYERGGMQNGYFTTYLIKGLSGSADTNHDRIVSAKELFTFVHGSVSQASGNRQHPVMWGKFPDTMPVMRW